MIDPIDFVGEGCGEVLGEAINPGDVGEIEVAPSTPGYLHRVVVGLCLFATITLLSLWFLWLWNAFSHRRWLFYVDACLTGLYLLAGYFLHPRPDYGNMGWFGGLMNNPFRYSDDINRFLFVFMIILLPGRFLTQSLVNPFILLVREVRQGREAKARIRELELSDTIKRAVHLPHKLAEPPAPRGDADRTFWPDDRFG